MGLVTHYLLFVISLTDRVVYIAGIPTRPDESWMLQIARNMPDAQSGALHAKLFRCESILLRSHWVLLVMDVFTRRIVGFGVERASIDGVSVCRMFNRPSLACAYRNTSERITIRCFPRRESRGV